MAIFLPGYDRLSGKVTGVAKKMLPTSGIVGGKNELSEEGAEEYHKQMLRVTTEYEMMLNVIKSSNKNLEDIAEASKDSADAARLQEIILKDESAVVREKLAKREGISEEEAKLLIREQEAVTEAINNLGLKMEMNLGLSLSEYFEEDIYKSLKKYKKATHVRIHDSGDFYSKEYLMRWLKIIRDNPKLTFYAYTKRISMFKAIKKYMPDNFIIIFSFGGKEDHLIDKETDRHAMVYESLDDMPSDYINASDNDLLAIQENKRVGLVYHGAKKIKGFKNVG